MDKAERERRHQARLERIGRVQVVAGRGDGLRVDHEATLLERARMTVQELASHEATERGLAAFDRLLRHAASRDARHSPDVARFLRAVRDRAALPLDLLRGVPAPVADDMLAVLDAFRHARLSLAEQVPGGAQRVARILARRDLADA